MIKFALIGAAGYVAPKHMKAIKAVGGELVAVLDPHDSVGTLDNYFKDCLYFNEIERFERYLEDNPVDYLSVCSPNYLHDSHCIMGLRLGAQVICEKPITCTVKNFDKLVKLQSLPFTRNVWPVLQLRYHPEVVKLKEWVKPDHKYHVDIKYVTHRGPWYDYSWKGDIEKSGGLATNIGVHLFDLCCHLFGKFLSVSTVKYINESNHRCSGNLIMENADIGYFLTVSYNYPIQRMIDITDCYTKENVILDLTKGFHDLHSEVYKRIIENDNPVPLESARESIKICEKIRSL